MQTAPTGTAKSPDDRATQFVPVEGAPETTSAGKLLVAAYALMWLLLVLFVLSGWRRQTALASRIARLEKALGASRGDGA